MQLRMLTASCLVGLLAGGCAAPPMPVTAAPTVSEPRAARPIFRWTQVDGGVITLGEPLAPAIARVGPADTVVSLPRGSFGGAERIAVHLAAGGVVRGLTFDYILGADYAAMVAEYERTLGPARRSVETRPGEVAADVAVWRDERTELRLVRDPNRSAWTVRAYLWDLSAPGAGPPRR